MKAGAYKFVDGSYERCEIQEATHVKIKLPGPSGTIFPCSWNGPTWTWNKNTEQPTIEPSILSRWTGFDEKQQVCHCFVTDGQVRFLSDSTHSLAGTSCPLLDIVY